MIYRSILAFIDADILGWERRIGVAIYLKEHRRPVLLATHSCGSVVRGERQSATALRSFARRFLARRLFQLFLKLFSTFLELANRLPAGASFGILFAPNSNTAINSITTISGPPGKPPMNITVLCTMIINQFFMLITLTEPEKPTGVRIPEYTI